MKIFITGIAGFIGSNLANKLHELGYTVAGCDTLQFGYKKNLASGMAFYNKDFKDLDLEWLEFYDVLVHCATSNIIYAQSSPLETFRTNAFESIKLISKFKGKIVYTSTSSVYGQAEIIPTPETAPENLSNAYDQSKAILEKYLQLRGNFTTLRLSNVYGENQRPENPYCGVVGRFIDQTLKDVSTTINGDGKDTRDFTYINDVVRALIIAIDQRPKNMEINIGTGIETSTFDLAVQIANMIDGVPLVKFVEKRSIDKINRRCLDITRAKKILGWKPLFDLEEGLKRTIEWQRGLK
jgi:UDP-glucose 4-epimerase